MIHFVSHAFCHYFTSILSYHIYKIVIKILSIKVFIQVGSFCESNVADAAIFSKLLIQVFCVSSKHRQDFVLFTNTKLYMIDSYK
jgi:hypothetical protein